MKEDNKTPVEQSGILSAEEYYKTECGRFDFGKTKKDGFINARQKDIERFAEEYHSQFEGKELPEEELRRNTEGKLHNISDPGYPQD